MDAETDLSRRAAAVRRAFRLEAVTLAWLAIETSVGVAAGMAADSTSLLAFGLDSAIELLSAGVLIWRLRVELQHGRVFSERAEHVAARIAGALLLALAAYVVASAAEALWSGHGQAFSVAGLTITAAAIPVMYVLGTRKLDVARQIASRALRADAVESITCLYMAAIVLVGQAVQALTGWWWIDAVAALGIVWFVAREGLEAWRGEDACEADD